MLNIAHQSTTDFTVLGKNPTHLRSLCKPQCFPNSSKLNYLAKHFPHLMDTEFEAHGCQVTPTTICQGSNGVKCSTYMEHYAFLCSRGALLREAHKDFSMVSIKTWLLHTHMAWVCDIGETRTQISYLQYSLLMLIFSINTTDRHLTCFTSDSTAEQQNMMLREMVHLYF